MAMGRSGGRSSRNRVGVGAERRATERERGLIDPPPADQRGPAEEPVRRYELTERGHRVLEGLAWTLWVVACGVLAILFARWFGLL